ncbi:MAG: alkaline phosphatase family protein [Myxococcales bacterium]|nr:alkaline phosphatase family protein [Myxococcota bacterium]MDW8282908.1 alkaline phosphatase family protein [Myxococcales bacterium]
MHRTPLPHALVLCALLLPAAAFGQTESRIVVKAGRKAPPAPAGDQGAPRLVVLLVADQFRAENLRRYAPWFSSGGFPRLLSRAAVATGHYGQQNTYTGPGHAIIATGSYGYLSGITQNKFFNRRIGRSEAMMFDPEATILGEKEGGPEEETSPRNLVGSTLGDQLRLQQPAAKVIAVALKGRGSILLGGHLGTAYFFSEQTGGMTTSTYYMKTLPDWVQRWNARRLADTYFGKKWERLLPESAYTAQDASPYEMDIRGLGRTFPHPLTGKLSAPGPAFYEVLTHAPAGLELQMDFVLTALDAEQLGRRGTTDLLGISWSATDLVGHAFGPDSQEYQDIVLRLDRVLAQLLQELDRRFRPGEVLLVFTADHGAAPIPEWMAAQKVQAGRITKATIKQTVGKALSERFGIAGDWVVAAEDPSLYLDEKLVQKAKADPAEVEDAAGRAALQIPGIIGYLTRTQLLRGWLPPTEAARAVARSYFPARGGDVVLITAPFYFWGKYGEKEQGSTHGSFYRYDTDVPVILSGPWFVPGHHGTIDMVDLAATLSHVLGLTPPSACEGRPIQRLLK